MQQKLYSLAVVIITRRKIDWASSFFTAMVNAVDIQLNNYKRRKLKIINIGKKETKKYIYVKKGKFILKSIKTRTKDSIYYNHKFVCRHKFV